MATFHCMSCDKTVKIPKTDCIVACPFCGNGTIEKESASVAKKTAERHLKRMEEIIPRYNELVNELSLLKKEYRVCYNTIAVYKRRGVIGQDIQIPLLSKSRGKTDGR